jgi:hypothetical protein
MGDLAGSHCSSVIREITKIGKKEKNQRKGKIQEKIKKFDFFSKI